VVEPTEVDEIRSLAAKVVPAAMLTPPVKAPAKQPAKK
jgi:hypothetical protein